MPYADFADGRLVELIRYGKAEAFQALVDRYQGWVFAIAFRILQNSEDARDASQVAWTEFYFKAVMRGRYDIERPIKPYLGKYATRCSIDVLEQRPGHLLGIDTYAESGSLLAHRFGVTTPDDSVDTLEAIRELRHHIDGLPECLRAVVVLQLEGRSNNEIAEVLEVEQVTVRQYRLRAIRQLRRCLGAEGVVHEQANA